MDQEWSGKVCEIDILSVYNLLEAGVTVLEIEFFCENLLVEWKEVLTFAKYRIGGSLFHNSSTTVTSSSVSPNLSLSAF
jgi:hypothetical protein